jgi:hypothetical protein
LLFSARACDVSTTFRSPEKWRRGDLGNKLDAA